MPFGSSCGYLSRRILKSQRLKKKCNKGVTLRISRHFHQKGRKYLIFVCLFICPFFALKLGGNLKKSRESFIIFIETAEMGTCRSISFLGYFLRKPSQACEFFMENHTHVYQNVYHKTICTPSAARDSPGSRDQIFLHVYQRAYLIII